MRHKLHAPRRAMSKSGDSALGNQGPSAVSAGVPIASPATGASHAAVMCRDEGEDVRFLGSLREALGVIGGHSFE